MTGGAAVTAEAPVWCVCGRLLTDEVSKARALGPRCFKRLHGQSRPPRRKGHISPQQLAIPYQLSLLDLLPVGRPVPYVDWIPGDRLHSRPVRTVPTSDLL